ncbi:MAG: RNA polymerase sigma factor [Clostridia bacterium]|nr:RNA polymerase sigma factor [Clostridia bacterium]
MEEKELVCRAKSGDREALNTLIEIYYGEIYSFLYRRTGNKAAAEDAAQNTFLRFIENLSNYKENGKLKSYLFTIAVNISNDYFREKKKETELTTENDGEENAAAGDFESGEKALAVRQAVLSLPEKQRDTVILKYYHGMKLTEIASVQKVPVSTVKTRLRRALIYLKECELW